MRALIPAILAALVAASGCGTGPALSGGGGVRLDELALRREYRLGPGDQLRVTVYGEEDLSGEFVVDGSGRLSLPLIGQVGVGRLTVRGLQQAIEARLRGRYLKHPRVTAEVMRFRPYYIMGEVESPGEYPYSAGLTVSRAVAAAGGFTYRANTRAIRIKRAGAGKVQVLRFESAVPVRPGDEIEIGERLF